MTRVLLIRHGQSEWNADGRWQGQADPALTELGRLQAVHASKKLGAFDAIVASDLQRAWETAGLIAGELGLGPVELDPDLRERHAGAWQGLTRVEIDRLWPGYLDPPPPIEGVIDPKEPASRVTEQGGPRRRPPGWEPDDVLIERATRALVRVHELAGDGEALVVTHGGLVYALEGLLGAEFVRLPNLGGRWFEVGPAGPKSLGDRVVLVDPNEITVPDQI